MYPVRFFTVTLIFTLPLFVFGQTTTPAKLPSLSEQRAEAQAKTDAIFQDYLKTFPTTEELRTKTLVSDISIKTDPEYPGPNETVTATVTGYLTDLNRSTIGWSVNGKVLDRNIGKKTFSFQSGDSGKTTTLTVTIVTRDNEYIKKELSFTPMGITMLWEADTYTPPFYKGKSLLTPEARVRVVAIPDADSAAGTIRASNLIYRWWKNGRLSESASGYGKNSFSFTGPLPYGEMGIRVSVSSVDSALRSEKGINLPISKPFVLFYENHPLLGVLYNHPLDTELSLTKKEISVNAEPYFFSNEISGVPAVSYGWSLNGNTVSNSGNILTLRNEAGASGSSALTLTVRGIKKAFQSASLSLKIRFTADDAESSNLFKL